jgi:hypothetical protein
VAETVVSPRLDFISSEYGATRAARHRRRVRVGEVDAAVYESAYGTKRTFGECHLMSAIGGKADIRSAARLRLDLRDFAGGASAFGQASSNWRR